MRALLVIAVLARAANAGPAKLDHVVAVVDDNVILRSELDARVDATGKPARVVLEEMIDEEVVAQAAARAHITASDEEVQAAIVEIEQLNELDDAGLAAELAAQGYTMASYRVELRRQLVRLRAINTLAPDRRAEPWIKKLRAKAYIVNKL